MMRTVRISTAVGLAALLAGIIEFVWVVLLAATRSCYLEGAGGVVGLAFSNSRGSRLNWGTA